MMIRKIYSLFIILLISEGVLSQTPFIRNYSPEEYKANTQNWDIVQDQRGVIYFANNGGILEYDGVNWRTIETPIGLKSLGIDNTGTIYAGCYGDFGYLQADSVGCLQYISLKDKVPAEHLDFRTITRIHTIENKIIFISYNKLFILHKDKIDVIPATNKYRNSFVVNNKLYIEIVKEGLFLLENDSLSILPEKEMFSRNSVWTMLPYNNNEILLAIHKQGIYIYNPNKSPSLRKPSGFEGVNNFLMTHTVRSGIVLPNGHFAVGSVTGGILVFNKDGKIEKRYYQHNGLQSNTAYYLYIDFNGQLWAALEDGISLIMNNLPFSFYTHQDGLYGSIYSIQVFKNRVYAGTGNSLYVKHQKHRFERIKETIGQNFFLYNANDKLLLGNIPNGILDIVDNKVLKSNTLKLHAIVAKTLRKNPNYILTQEWNKELALIEFKYNRWVFKHFIKGFNKNAQMIEEDNNGDFWISTHEQLYKLRLNNALDSVISVQKFEGGHSHLPEGEVSPYRLNNEVVFSTSKGIFRYHPNTNSFEQHPDFDIFPNGVNYITQDAHGNIWFEEYANHLAEKGVMRMNKGRYDVTKTPFLKFKENPLGNPGTLYPYSDSIIYFGLDKGLLEYYPKQSVNYNIPYNTLIREVLVNDSLLFGGASFNDSSLLQNKPIILNTTENNLFFRYSATFYEDSEKTLFSYRLIGNKDTTWSAWTTNYQKEYTNLREGRYVFEVRSQNIYRKIGNTASFAFEILPPWYRTLWAYCLFIILAIALIGALNRINSARLEHQNKILKKRVNEHTADISKQKEMLQIQAEALKENNKKLKLLNATKDKFFTIISHDLRNPFNSILGLTSLLDTNYDNFDDNQKKEIISSLNKSSQHAFDLLEKLLTWARSRSGKIDINKELLNLNELVKTSITPYEQLAAQKNIKIEINIPDKTKISIDRNTAMTIIGNLVTNAIKFTPEGGSVTINYHEKEDNIELHFIDTGIGISPEVIEQLFKIDQDISTIGTNNEKGTGLGLILCKEFITKNGGDISVVSTKGKGSDFIITLPKS